MATNRRYPPAGAAGRGSTGFVLVAVMVALVVITLLAAAVATVSERAVAEAQADADDFAAEVAMASTRDTVLYLLVSQRQTLGGLTVDDQMVWTSGQATAPRDGTATQSAIPVGNEIRLDGTPYRGLGDIAFSLQDDAGLFSPNWASAMYRDRFFRMHGMEPSEWAGLEAKRLDFQDPDSLVRLGGQEADGYRREGLPPPPNHALVTPLQVRRIKGWDRLLEGLDDAALMSTLTLARTSNPNLNTAPVEVLRTVPGIDEATAERMASLRTQAPFLLDWLVIREFQLPLTIDDPVRLFGSGSGILRLWHNAAGPTRVLHWTLTPADEGGRPWRIDYEITLPRDDKPDPAVARPTQAPLLAGASAARD